MDREIYFLFRLDSWNCNYKHRRIFLFEPEAKIRQVAYYFVNGSWVKEYDYYFNTNKLGLVQSKCPDFNKESMLLLGDSFTQGLGAPPWADDLSQQVASNNNKYQLVNAGIFGTGFAQWYLLDQYLIKKGIKVGPLAVIFISDVTLGQCGTSTSTR